MDEYVIVNKSDLTSMADSIRDALGSTDSIAVSDLSSKLIESIQAGGGSEIDFSPFKSIIYGTYTPAEDVNSFSVPNPNNISGLNAFFVISRIGGTIGSIGVDSALFQSMYNQLSRLKYSSNSSTNNYPTAVGFAEFGFGSYYLIAGVTYWYAFGVR